MVQYSRTIPPGGEGDITLRIDTEGLQGHLKKKAKVHSNSPDNPLEIISIRAFVRPPISVSKKHISLQGPVGETASTTITIRAEKERPLNLQLIEFNLGDRVSYEIQEVEAGKLFRIHFSSIPGQAELYHGFLKLKTNYPKMPRITIRIRGQFNERR